MNDIIIDITTHDNGSRYINARELHSKLNIGREFAKWIRERIKRYEFVENIDYIYFVNSQKTKNGGRPSLEYNISIDMTIEILIKEKNKNSIDILNYLLKINKNYKVITRERDREEIIFVDKLEKTLIPLGYKLEKQKNVFGGKYRIDGYIKDLKLAIEYDEGQHSILTNKKKDILRQKEIEEELNCTFIRLDYNNDDNYNIGIIIKEIINKEVEH